MTEQITPEQALANLDNAVATLNVNRQSHFVLQQSVMVLQQVLKGLRKEVVEPQEGESHG